MENNQREITPKVIQARVMVLKHDTSSHRALLVYEVSLKYPYGLRVIERTRSCIENNQKEITP